jgi:hypothetical protein
MDAVANHLGVEVDKRPDHHELMKEVGAKQVLEEIESRESVEEKPGGKQTTRSPQSRTD